MYASLKSLLAKSASRSNARRLVLALCLCSLLLGLWAYARSAPLPLTVLLLNLATLVVLGLRHWNSRKSIKFQPQELADRLLQVQENERHRLSRDLHDDIGQLLTAAKLQSEWLKRRLPEDLQGQCTVLCNTLNETLPRCATCPPFSTHASWPAWAWKPACARTCSRPWKTPRFTGAWNASNG